MIYKYDVFGNVVEIKIMSLFGGLVVVMDSGGNVVLSVMIVVIYDLFFGKMFILIDVEGYVIIYVIDQVIGDFKFKFDELGEFVIFSYV